MMERHIFSWSGVRDWLLAILVVLTCHKYFIGIQIACYCTGTCTNTFHYESISCVLYEGAFPVLFHILKASCYSPPLLFAHILGEIWDSSLQSVKTLCTNLQSSLLLLLPWSFSMGNAYVCLCWPGAVWLSDMMSYTYGTLSLWKEYVHLGLSHYMAWKKSQKIFCCPSA